MYRFALICFIALSVLLFAGHAVRMKVRLFQRLYVPSCLIGGFIGLAVVQAMIYFGKGNVAEPFLEIFGQMPRFLINIVFACLFLGVRLPKFTEIWRRAGHQLAYGQIVAWGQYAVALLVFLVLIQFIWPGIPSTIAGILPVGFEGGHGTAAAMEQVFADNGFEAGKDLALTSATLGILGAVVFGMVLINWANRKGYTVRKADPVDIEEDDSIGVISIDKRPSAGRLTVNSDVVESFSLHLAIVGIAIMIGYLMYGGLMWLAQLFDPAHGDERVVIVSATFSDLLRGFPLFPLCMFGGLVVQFFEQKFDKHKVIDIGLMKRIQNSSLDFLIIAAIVTINIKVVAEMFIPLLILAAAGVIWNIICVMYIAPRVFPNAWFERSIAEMGQSMGVTATGLLLLRVVDPDYETPAVDAFAYKQLLHEPIMGGGIWTVLAVPLIVNWGAIPVLAISIGAMAVWVIVLSIISLSRK